MSAFSEKTTAPSPRDLEAVLGKAYGSWTRLIALVAERIDPLTEVWKFTSASTGWGLRVCHRKRVIFYMTPQKNQFLVSFALGEKAVAATADVALSDTVRRAIDAAPRYAEGRGVRLEVKDNRELPSFATLAEIKWRS